MLVLHAHAWRYQTHARVASWLLKADHESVRLIWGNGIQTSLSSGTRRCRRNTELTDEGPRALGGGVLSTGIPTWCLAGGGSDLVTGVG
jgi:hypothetical protein